MNKLRTFYYAPTTSRSNNQWHRFHIEPILRNLSNDFQYFNPVSSKKICLEEIHKLILARAKKHKTSFFFSLTTDAYLLPETIKELRNLGIITVNFTCDNLDRLYDIQGVAPALDVCWVTEPEAVSMIKKIGGNPIHLPMAANPAIFRPYNCREKYDISFCGMKNGSRPWYIYNLLKIQALHLRVGGVGWSNIGDTAIHRATMNPEDTINYLKSNLSSIMGFRNIAGDLLHLLFEPKLDASTKQKLIKSLLPKLEFDDYIKLYSESKISLGFNEKGNSYHLPNPTYQLRLRDFEAPMSGSCFLTHRSQEMESYFEEDKEVLFYSSFEELVQKSKFYLDPKRDSIRKKIKVAARQRSLRQHTWDHRLKALFSKMLIQY
ncbi:MAG: glycosyltransferase [Candidatus Pacebacteria bacterium]|nr:glycosyltransferase [Candidatus Paceibacterota bacterium]